MAENKIGDIIVESAVNLHRELGPGLLEIVYQVVFARELEKRGLTVEREVTVAIEYKGVRFDQGFRADLIVEKKVIVELKSVDSVSPVWGLHGCRCPGHRAWACSCAGLLEL